MHNKRQGAKVAFGGLSLEKKMADQVREDAMIIIQEASAKIAQVSDKLSGLENNNQEVVAALKDLSNKVGSLENERVPNHPGKSLTTKAPLYTQVSNRVSEGVFGRWGLSGHAANLTRSVGLSVCLCYVSQTAFAHLL